MKTTKQIMALALFLITASWALAQNDSVKTQRIIKTVEIAPDGTTTVDSVVIDLDGNFRGFYGPRHGNFGQQPYRQFRMQGPGRKGMMWSNTEDFEYEITVDESGDSTKVFVMKTPCGLTREFTSEGNFPQGRMGAMNQGGNQGYGMQKGYGNHRANGNRQAYGNRRQAAAPGRQVQSNHINLNDPKVKSFEKEVLKNGDEKITIIREK